MSGERCIWGGLLELDMDGADVEDGFLGLVGHGPHVEGYQHEGTLKLHPIECWREIEYNWSARRYSKLMDVSTEEDSSMDDSSGGKDTPKARFR